MRKQWKLSHFPCDLPELPKYIQRIIGFLPSRGRMFLEVRSEQIFRDWTTFIRIFFQGYKRSCLNQFSGWSQNGSGVDQVGAGVQTTGQYTLSVFSCSGGLGQGYSDPNQHKWQPLWIKTFFQLAERLFLMAVFNFAVLCTFFWRNIRCCPIPTSCQQWPCLVSTWTPWRKTRSSFLRTALTR